MNASEKKGDESKVRREQTSREEAKEDENLVLRTFALIVSVHLYCARESHATSHATSCIERAR